MIIHLVMVMEYGGEYSPSIGFTVEDDAKKYLNEKYNDLGYVEQIEVVEGH